MKYALKHWCIHLFVVSIFVSLKCHYQQPGGYWRHSQKAADSRTGDPSTAIRHKARSSSRQLWSSSEEAVTTQQPSLHSILEQPSDSADLRKHEGKKSNLIEQCWNCQNCVPLFEACAVGCSLGMLPLCPLLTQHIPSTFCVQGCTWCDAL